MIFSISTLQKTYFYIIMFAWYHKIQFCIIIFFYQWHLLELLHVHQDHKLKTCYLILLCVLNIKSRELDTKNFCRAYLRFITYSSNDVSSGVITFCDHIFGGNAFYLAKLFSKRPCIIEQSNIKYKSILWRSKCAERKTLNRLPPRDMPTLTNVYRIF